ncbi:hypothetical protein NDU88_004369 [Pleurodeles waltl]|uniref:Uncharacterized protein n=1 Tax=Pleurodeles waltl TaxID=8319 RepID=A0AAV7UEY0_PLEWA|nr:hypothetical protein NDU88_004369 [Pleurodeles waltl]
MAACQGGQEPLKPETVAQGTAKKRKGRGLQKPVPEFPTVWEEAEPEGDALELTGEQVAEMAEVPQLSQWQQEEGPTKEAFCEAQKMCPTLEGLRQQAAAQAAGEELGSHLIYWKYGLLYNEPKVPEPESAHVLVLHAGSEKPDCPSGGLAQENVEASQEDMKCWYDKNATLVEFQPGQKVWVMASEEARALQEKCIGLFEVVDCKSELTCLVDLQTPRNPLRVLHVNRLKPHFERTEFSMLLATHDEVEEENEPLPDLLSAGEKDGSVEGVNLSPSLTT